MPAGLDRIRRFLEPPSGCVCLRYTRFLQHRRGKVLRDLGEGVVDELFMDGPGGSVDDERSPGRRLRWLDERGRTLRELTVHPARADLDVDVLPWCLAAVTRSRSRLEIWVQEAGGSPVQVDALDGADPLGTAETHVYRDHVVPSAFAAAAETCVRLGWGVESIPGRLSLRAEVRGPAQPGLLVLMPVVVPVAIPLLALRVMKDLRPLRKLWRSGVHGDTERVDLHVGRDAIEFVVDDGYGPERRVVPYQEVGAVLFLPSGSETSPKDRGTLWLVGGERARSVPHVPPGQRDPQVARASGRALVDLLRVLVASSHRG